MSGVPEVGMAKDQRAERAAGGKREVRWSVRRKEEIVLRLLRVSRSICSLARRGSRRGGSPGGGRISSPPGARA